MSYQVFARKYRPQSFDQMVGQSHISQTLINALKSGRVPHAILFTGLRGTGKTTSARILAKTLRCENPVNFSPCNVCPSCIEANSGRAVDIIEIDGASNNGVDAIRDLRDSVMFMPTSGKYKIFIIDEVHMLSTAAFNALLKTLEEPPAHVIFMMATTEINKIPQTILSRCQRFDLRRIPFKQMAGLLRKICDLEKIEADDKALWLIARQGDGSARDSLSLLDQVVNFTTGQLTEQNVAGVLGLTDRGLIYDIYAHLLERNPKAIVADLEKAHTMGTSPSLFFEELIQLLRHTIVLKTAPDSEILIDLPAEEVQSLREFAKTQSDSDLHMLFDMALKALSDLVRATDPFMVFEVCLLRIAQAPRISDIQNLLSGATMPTSNQVAGPKFQGLLKTESTPVKPAVVISEPVKPQPAAPVVKPTLNAEGWMKFVSHLKQESAFLAAKLDNIIFAGLNDKHFTLEAAAQFSFLAEQLTKGETHEKLQGFIDSFFGEGYTFTVIKAKVASGDSAKSMNQKIEKISEDKITTEILQDPRVLAAQKVFKAQVKIISTKE
ncbi:DNA polymerase III subunit gamma/tau [Bdellovibrio sp. qaytius]|nr:DNA polymerase III subunit gamma/tau [Bdellovibrio sp. qaytius]